MYGEEEGGVGVGECVNRCALQPLRAWLAVHESIIPLLC